MKCVLQLKIVRNCKNVQLYTAVAHPKVRHGNTEESVHFFVVPLDSRMYFRVVLYCLSGGIKTIKCKTFMFIVNFLDLVAPFHPGIL